MLNKKGLAINENQDIALGLALLFFAIIVLGVINDSEYTKQQELLKTEVEEFENKQLKIDAINLVSDEFIFDTIMAINEDPLDAVLKDLITSSNICTNSLKEEINKKIKIDNWQIIVTSQNNEQIFFCDQTPTYIDYKQEILIPTNNPEEHLILELYTK